MNKKISLLELRATIIVLEAKREIEFEMLQEQFKETYESLKPVNLIKRSFKNFIQTPELGSNFLNIVMGITAGNLTKKAAIGGTHNPIKLLFGNLLQVGVTGFVARNGDAIKSVTRQIIIGLFAKKEVPQEED